MIVSTCRPREHPLIARLSFNKLKLPSYHDLDRLVTNEKNFDNWEKFKQSWHLVRVTSQFDILDPAVEADISAWTAAMAKQDYIYNLGVALFESQADAALFVLFWS